MSDKEDWYDAIASSCQICGSRQNLVQHHVIFNQELRRAGGDPYDPRNALTLCHGIGDGCHPKFHQRTAPIPLTALSDENLAFAFELMGVRAVNYLTRHYSGEDFRLEQFLFVVVLDEGYSENKI